MVMKVEKKHLHTWECLRKQKIADLHRAESHVLSMRGSDIRFA